MGMTMTQKILAAHAGLESVKAGQLIEAKLDLVLGNDVTTPVAIKEFNKIGVDKVFDKDKVAIVPDHLHQTRILSLLNTASSLENLLIVKKLQTISK